MPKTQIAIDSLQSWVGREQRSVDALNPFPARALATALDRAELSGEGGALPALWHWLYFIETPRGDGTGPDGHPLKGGFLPPIPLARRMWAAGRVQVHRPLRLGVPAEKVTTIGAIDLKQGRTGVLVFVALTHSLQQEGDTCVREEQQLVYRDTPQALSTSNEPAQPTSDTGPADWSVAARIDPVLLFRFSALTYNGHRIHYDRDYATRVEHYPGLVVHGPLLAILLLEQLSHHVPDQAVADFRFRALRPTFEGVDVRLCGRREGSDAILWTSGRDGVGITATAQLARRHVILD
jgi:3-methylfumaryl-CoA hydratase